MLTRSISALAAVLVASSLLAAEGKYDVVIYGGTSGGVAAAVQVRRMGKTCVLIEPGKHLGGLTSGGLGATDIGNKAAIGGIAREFYQAIRKHYEDPAAWKQSKQAVPNEDAMWVFEPRVAEAVYRQWVKDNGIEVVFGERLDLKRGVQKDGARIVSIAMESGAVFVGKRFIDATYEGDLMAKAGVSYHVGREANSVYGETLNGVQVKNAKHHQLVPKVDAYVKPGDPASGLLPGVVAGPPGEEGSGDKRVQAYNFRICFTDVAENRLPIEKPAGYSEARYELLLRNFEAGETKNPWNPVMMPNRKTDANNNFGFSSDNIGMNYDYPDGDYATREKIIEEHRTYQQGLMWTLANHPRVPQAMREYFQKWGPAKDEFVETQGWPHQLYVREARRMISDYVMSQNDCQGKRKCDDPVGLGAYNMDSHNVQRYVDANGHARNEGDVQVGVSPYPIAYRSIVPKKSECSNLLVPVCLSASHISYGSIRMEPVFMVLGQSAATAACQTIDDKVDVQQADYAKLNVRLLADKQVLEWKGPTRGGASAEVIELAKLEGVVVDDVKAVKKGDWLSSSTIGPYVGDGYIHDDNAEKGEKSLEYRFTVPKPGKYAVRIYYTANGNRASNVPVKVQHASGAAEVKLNQKQPPGGKGFTEVGVFEFEKEGAVIIGTAGTNGHVVADAVQVTAGK